MTNQFGEHIDSWLERLSDELDKAIRAKDEAAQRFDAVWRQIFLAFNNAVGENKEARFIASNGHTLSREISEPESRLDHEAVLQALALNYPPAEAQALWERITVPSRTFSQTLFADALNSGELDPAMFKDAVIYPAPVTSRQRRKHSIEDAAWIKERLEQSAPESSTG